MASQLVCAFVCIIGPQSGSRLSRRPLIGMSDMPDMPDTNEQQLSGLSKVPLLRYQSQADISTAILQVPVADSDFPSFQRRLALSYTAIPTNRCQYKAMLTNAGQLSLF